MAAPPPNATQEPVKIVDLLHEGKNKTAMYCKRCPSLVLSAENATLVEIEKEFYLPNMYKKKVESLPDEGEELRDFWLVDNMYTFENVGFSNTVDNIKYLTCADCEIGPIGWHDTSGKACYVAVNRVRYQ